jgi:hypothetical protein
MSAELHHTHNVRIHIDQKPYESPNPTTGEAVYRLGNVPAGLVLYREVRGDKEDTLIPNSAEPIHLTQDEHFHSGQPREITIIVNGTKKTVRKEELSFSEVVILAFENPPYGENTLFTITYRRGPANKPEGILAEGESVKIKDGMIFDVTATDKS